MSKRVVLIDGSRGVHVSTCRWMVYSFIVADGMLSPRPPAMVLHTSTSTMAGPAGIGGRPLKVAHGTLCARGRRLACDARKPSRTQTRRQDGGGTPDASGTGTRSGAQPVVPQWRGRVERGAGCSGHRTGGGNGSSPPILALARRLCAPRNLAIRARRITAQEPGFLRFFRTARARRLPSSGAALAGRLQADGLVHEPFGTNPFGRCIACNRFTTLLFRPTDRYR